MNTNRIYGHQELASLYFPHILPESASTQLRRWINRDEDLLGELRRAGHIKGMRIYTPLMVAILVSHLGDPETWSIK